MARKKAAPPTPPSAVAEPPEHPKEHRHRDVSSTAVENLKSLNGFLVRETMEMREQVKSLTSQVDEVALLSGIQDVVLLSAFTSQLASLRDAWVREAEEAARSAERRLLAAELEEKEALLRSLEGMQRERDREGKRAEEMQQTVVTMEAEKVRMEKVRAEVVASEARLRSEVARLALEVEAAGAKEVAGGEKVQELEKENWELSRVVAGLTKENRLMRLELEAEGLKVLELEGRKAELEGVLGGMRLDAEAKDLKIAGMEKEIEGLERAVGELSTACEETAKKLEDAQGLCRLFEESREELLLEVGHLQKEVELLAAEERGKGVKIVELQKENAELVGEVEKLREGIVILEEENGLMRQEVEANGLKILEIERRNEELEGDVGRLKGEVGVARKGKEAMSLKVVELEKENGELSSRNGELIAACKEMEDVRAVLLKKVEDLQCSCRLLEEAKQQLLLKIAQLKGEVESIRVEERAKTMKVFKLEKVNGELVEEVGRFTVVVAKLEDDNGFLRQEGEQRKREYEGEMSRLEGEMSAMRMDGEAKSLKAAEMEKDNKVLWDKVGELTTFCEELRNIRAELVKEVQDSWESCRLLEESKEQLLLKVAHLQEDVQSISRKERTEHEKVLELEMVIGKFEEEGRRLTAVIANLEAEISSLRHETEANALKVLRLEKRKCELESETMASKEAIRLLRMDEQANSLKVAGMEKENKELRSEVSNLTMTLNVQMEESVEKGKKFDEELKRKLQEKAAHEVETVELRERIDRLECTISGLQNQVTDQSETIRILQTEKEGLQGRLDKQAEEAKALVSQLETLKKNKFDIEEEFCQLRSTHDRVAKEKTETARDLHSAMEGKALIEKDLAVSHASLKDMGRRLEAASNISRRALTTLKHAVNSMHGKEFELQGHEEELNVDELTDKDLGPFISELESIEKDYKSKTEEVEVIKHELHVLQASVEDAEKKRGFFAWLSSVSALVAALSVAYAAKGH